MLTFRHARVWCPLHKSARLQRLSRKRYQDLLWVCVQGQLGLEFRMRATTQRQYRVYKAQGKR